MKWIEDVDNDLINLEQIEYIGLFDRGESYQERFQIVARSFSQIEYVIKKFRKEKDAKEFMKTLEYL